jgi:hypothetical protein
MHVSLSESQVPSGVIVRFTAVPTPLLPKMSVIVAV